LYIIDKSSEISGNVFNIQYTKNQNENTNER
jgi:hypothetical protein